MRNMQPDQPRSSYQYGALGGASAAGLGSGLGSGRGTRPSNPDEIGTTSADFDAFEKLLTEVQTAYGAEDLGKLRNRATRRCSPTLWRT